MSSGRLADLGRHIAAEQDRLLTTRGADDALRQRLADRVAARSEPASRRRWALAAVPVIGVALGTAAAFAVASADRPAPLTFTIGKSASAGTLRAWVSATEGELPIVFSEGSRVLLHEGARARVVDTSSQGADVVVEAGAASVEVVPHDATRWQVHSGPFIVHVTGTRFDVEWKASIDTVRVRLYEGGVRVTGCSLGEGQLLSAGQQLVATCKDGRVRTGLIGDEQHEATEDAARTSAIGRTERSEGEHMAAALPAEADDKTVRKAGERGPSARLSHPAAAPDTPWQTQARSARYAEACRAGRQASTSTPSDLLLLGDACRLAGDAGRAREIYSGIRSRFPDSRFATRAAFELGRMESRAGREQQAARWYRTYLAQAPRGALAPAALGRLLEIEVRAGRQGAAERLAAEYVARYPEGAHADAARKVLGKSAAR